jgi:hypothetical protein
VRCPTRSGLLSSSVGPVRIGIQTVGLEVVSPIGRPNWHIGCGVDSATSMDGTSDHDLHGPASRSGTPRPWLLRQAHQTQSHGRALYSLAQRRPLHTHRRDRSKHVSLHRTSGRSQAAGGQVPAPRHPPQLSRHRSRGRRPFHSQEALDLIHASRSAWAPCRASHYAPCRIDRSHLVRAGYASACGGRGRQVVEARLAHARGALCSQVLEAELVVVEPAA